MRSSRWAMLATGLALALAGFSGGCGSVSASRGSSDAFSSALPTGSQIDGDNKWRHAGNTPSDAAPQASKSVVAHR